MKKLLIAILLVTSLAAHSQGVKISAMPQWTTSLDSVWFPIIYNNGSVWLNYRAQGWQIGNHFGMYGEDDIAAEDRQFDLNTHYFNYTASTGSVSFVFNDGGANASQFVMDYSQVGATYTNTSGAGSNFSISNSTATLGVSNSSNGHSAAFELFPSSGSIYSQALLSFGGVDNGTTYAQTETGFIYSIPAGQDNTLLDFQIDNLPPATGVSENYIVIDAGNKLRKGSSTSGGGGGGSGIQSVDFANGLTARNDSTGILGGTLDQNTTVAGFSNTNNLTWSGTYTSSGTMFTIANSGSGSAFGVTNNGGSTTGLFQNSSNGTALSATSSSGVALVVNTTSGSNVARFVTTPSSTNSTVNTIELTRATSGTAAAGMANQLQFSMEVNLDGSTTSFSNGIISEWVDPANATRTSKLIIRGINNATQGNIVEFLSDGNIRQLVTGKGYGLKSPDGTTWYIKVDNSGVLSTSTTAP